MNIINIDFEKGTVQSDFFHWKIISNNDNKFLLLQREESGRFHAAEADVKKKQTPCEGSSKTLSMAF